MSSKGFSKINNSRDRSLIRKFVISRLENRGIYNCNNRTLTKNKNKALEKLYWIVYKTSPTVDYLERKKRGRNSEDRFGKVYFIGNLDYKLVKIGFSKDPIERVKSLQTGCPFPIELFHQSRGTREDETKLHKLYTDLRVNGEWFKIAGGIERFLKEFI